MARRLLLLAAACLLVGAPGASASSRLVPLGADPRKAGPVLGADGSLTWVAADASGVRVMRVTGTGAPTVIAQLPASGAPADVEERMTYELASSDQVIAVRRFSETCRD